MLVTILSLKVQELFGLKIMDLSLLVKEGLVQNKFN
jgi:hypothetical protein